MALRDSWSVQQAPHLVSAVSDSGSYPIGLITLDVKGAGARSAGNPLATCDVAGVGNGIFNEDSRAQRSTLPRILSIPPDAGETSDAQNDRGRNEVLDKTGDSQLTLSSERRL